MIQILLLIAAGMTALSAGLAPAPGAGPAMADDAAMAEAERIVPETPEGRMTTAQEVRPILEITKPQWVALRPWEGSELLYFTNLLAWRCGVLEIAYAVNDGPRTVLDVEPCHMETAVPNAIKAEDVQPYIRLAADELVTLEVFVLYDDGTRDAASYERAAILMP